MSRKLPDDRIAMIHRLLVGGLSLPDVAKQTGCTVETVRKYRRTIPAPTPDPATRPKRKVSKAVRDTMDTLPTVRGYETVEERTLREREDRAERSRGR